jgi:hypothetical protein
MCRAFIALACALVAILAWPAAGGTALSCGLPETPTTWIDFADSSVTFWRDRFARPGVVVATGGPGLASEARAAGAGTVHWDMYLRKRVGTPSDPADPSLIEKRADALFDYAAEVSGCEAPLIALNELWGSSLPTPLTPSAERYRANVLRFVTRLSERGGHPALLVSSEPFTGGDAAAWWKSVAAVSDLVLEKYANANLIWRDGPVDGSRRLRVRYRESVAKLLAVGVQSSRIGLMIGFQTGPGAGGREGLKPRSRWFDVTKWQALAARQVARELNLSHIWSWGWAQRDARSDDPDKTYAACVWLWSRDASLCDAPEILGKELDTDVRTGQLNLPAGHTLHLRHDAAHRLERRVAREGDPGSRGRADCARRAGDRAGASPGLAIGCARRRASNRAAALRRQHFRLSRGARRRGRQRVSRTRDPR